MSGSAKQSGSVEDATQAGTACTSHLLRDISGLNCQVQMISDSLAACKRMSNYRSVRRDCNYAVMTQARSKPTPQTPVQVLLPPEERTLVFLPGRKWKSVIVSYMINGKTNLSHLQKSRRFARREEALSESNSGDDIRGACRSSRSWSLEEISQFSDVDICAREKANSRWAFDAAIRAELETLMEMNPDLVLIITGLFDILYHCKGCSRCNKKIRSSISWILSRIQKLVNYVAIKKRKTCVLARDPVRLPGIERKEVLSEEPTEDRRRIGRSEKVEAFAVSANYPGIQILLKVKIDTLGKRNFARTESRRVGPLIGAHPTLQLHESSTVPLVVAFQPRLILCLERQFFALKKVRLDFRALLCLEPSRVASSAVVRSLAVTTRTASSNSSEPYEETRFQGQGRLLAVAERSESSERKRPATQSREDLKKGEMHVQKVRELEGEVKGLKDLMMEVHKNQVELSRVLVEKGLRSRGLLLLGDPATLEEESEVSKNEKVLEIRETSADGTQLMVNDLKRKCSVKNRMIVTLLKGLRSDVPEEWWEELIKHVFDDETDPEKVDEFIRQTSLFLLDGEKGSTVPPPTPQNEGFSSEEEPKTRGAEVEDALKYVFNFDEIAEKRSDAFLEDKPPVRTWAFPDAEATAKLTWKKFENQMTVLNAENDRLGQHNNDLKDILKTSMTDTKGKENIRLEPDEKISPITKPRKTINLAVRIEEEELRRRAGPGCPEREQAENFPGSFGPIENEQMLSVKLPREFPSKSKRRHSKHDLKQRFEQHSLDDGSPVFAEWARALPRNKEKLRILAPQEKGKELVGATPCLSCQEIWPPDVVGGSVSDAAGPSSRRLVDLNRVLQVSSVAEWTDSRRFPGMSVAMSNERQLGTIPENEHADWATSSSTPESSSQTIQRLGARVGLIRKDVNFLKSKNDRIDMFLSRRAKQKRKLPENGKQPERL